MKTIEVLDMVKCPKYLAYPCRNVRTKRYDKEKKNGLNISEMEIGDSKIVKFDGFGDKNITHYIKQYASQVGMFENIHLQVEEIERDFDGKQRFKITHDGYR